jgi:hypothetical protein
MDHHEALPFGSEGEGLFVRFKGKGPLVYPWVQFNPLHTLLETTLQLPFDFVLVQRVDGAITHKSSGEHRHGFQHFVISVPVVIGKRCHVADTSYIDAQQIHLGNHTRRRAVGRIVPVGKSHMSVFVND